eukprot:7384418-Prymnesium_polylepis.1
MAQGEAGVFVVPLCRVVARTDEADIVREAHVGHGRVARKPQALERVLDESAAVGKPMVGLAAEAVVPVTRRAILEWAVNVHVIWILVLDSVAEARRLVLDEAAGAYHSAQLLHCLQQVGHVLLSSHPRVHAHGVKPNPRSIEFTHLHAPAHVR